MKVVCFDMQSVGGKENTRICKEKYTCLYERVRIMRTFFMNGISKDISYFLENIQMFYIQELSQESPDRYIYPGDYIKYDLDGELVLLYDTLRDMLFEDTQKYYMELSSMPIFAQEAGQNSECGLTAELFSEWIQKDQNKKLPNFYKHLYLVDCQFLVGTIQNLLCGMEDSFIRYYILISSVCVNIEPSEPNVTMFQMSPYVGTISATLENYFIKAYSILDMLCKIGHEFKTPQKDFSSYKKMRSADILWGARKDLEINNTEGTIFEKCELISVIESLRNEVVHNGTWELNPKAYIKYKNGVIVEKYMLFPDISQGRLATVKGRKHFFGNGTKVNEVLPRIHKEFKIRLLNTIKLLNQKKFNVNDCIR